MKKIKCFKVFVFFVIGLLSLTFVTHLESNVAIGATNTDSAYVNTVTDLEKTDLLGGVSLYEQKMNSLLNGDSAKIFQEHFVQWVDLENYDNGVKLVTWTKQNADSWNAATTKICAQDWEAHHPGWIVVAGVNGDFFQNSGKITWEPTNNFMADGDMYRADYVGGHRKVIGISDNNEIIVGDPEISDLYLQLMSSEGEVVEQFPIASYNEAPKETGINLYTKDMIESHDLTGYTVYVGKYTMCRISNGTNETVFVKGSIETSRPGTVDEKPRQIREVTTEDGGTKQEITREFYLATKDSSYEQKLQNGTLVRCQHNYEGNWSNVTQSVGFIHQMLVDGKSQFQKSTDSFIYTDHPRTFIGFKADGTPVLMVVDGRGKTAAEKNYGVSLFEGAEIMKLAGCVDAYNLDGGGSSTLIVRNNEGGFDVVNRPSDGSERSTGNAIFLVMRDPAVESKLGKATPTTITIERKEDEYSQSVENLTVKVDGKTYPMTGKEITIEGLKENTTYDVEISYEIEGEECKSSIKAQTKAYYAGLNFIPRSHGFIVEKYQTDEVLRTVSASIQVGEKVYEMGDVERYEIEGLLKNASYEISYKYVVENQQTKERYEKESEGQTYQTLSYEIPEIESFEIDRKTSNKISIKYGYTDIDKIVKEAYIQMNEEIRKIGTTSGIETFEGINTYKERYEFKLVIKYEDESGRIYEIESEKIEVEKEACEHEYDNECDEECNRCGEKREAPHRWEEASCEEAKRCRRCGKTEGEALGHEWEEATYERPKECKRCGKTEGEALKRPGEPAEEKGCKKCSKTKVISILTWIGLFSGAIVLLRKKK